MSAQEYLSADAAADYLGVSKQTLYAYVSRGLVSSEPGADSRTRARRYPRQQLDRLRRERDTMGPVNLRADAEAVEVQAQIDNMARERDDLEAAIGKLRHAIAALNKEGRERLQAAFGTVNDHFEQLFTHLFGGGAAHLELSDSDDPLDAGLEIFASPPGKRLQNLSLLSGGEQALTALALIFAVS